MKAFVENYAAMRFARKFSRECRGLSGGHVSVSIMGPCEHEFRVDPVGSSKTKVTLATESETGESGRRLSNPCPSSITRTAVTVTHVC